jgi:hypothetical protein
VVRVVLGVLSLKCIRAGGSQGCVGSFVLLGLFKLVYLEAQCAVPGVSWRSITL